MLLPCDLYETCRPQPVGERPRRVLFESGGGEEVGHAKIPGVCGPAALAQRAPRFPLPRGQCRLMENRSPLQAGLQSEAQTLRVFGRAGTPCALATEPVPLYERAFEFGQRALRAASTEIIMAVPKRKTSPSKRGMRRSADALQAPTYVEDKDSGELRRPHHLDLKTGMYRGRQVLKVKAKEV